MSFESFLLYKEYMLRLYILLSVIFFFFTVGMGYMLESTKEEPIKKETTVERKIAFTQEWANRSLNGNIPATKLERVTTIVERFIEETDDPKQKQQLDSLLHIILVNQY